ncbi:MAG: sulfur carrier protein ThiS [Neisseria sp.]|nr:sulfur carrier protein ThiS [Neisseria sp.]
MNIILNGKATFFTARTLADLIAETAPQKPFAAAVNTVFVPKSRYETTLLQENDQVEIVRPVVGG